MRKGWEYKKLGEVGTFLRGKNILKSDFVEKGFPCIHYGQIHTKFGISTDTHLTETSQEVYNKAIIASKNDVLIAITSEDLEGSCKATAWLGDYDVAVSAHAAVFKHNLNPKYIVYYLKSQSFYIEKSKYARGFKVMEIKPTDIAKIPIPIPPKSTQLAIVSELDKINELIHLKKEQLKDFDNLAQSLFYEMFGDPVENEKGWEVKKLGEICEIFAGGDKPKDMCEIQNNEYIYPVIANGEGEKGILGYTKNCRVTKEAVTIGARGASIGNCRIVKNGFTPAIRLLTLIPTGSIDCCFLYYFVKDLNYKQNGAGQAQLTVPNIKCEFIPLPPLPLQHLFALRIEQIEREKSEVQKSIQDLETLLASRMQYWFE